MARIPLTEPHYRTGPKAHVSRVTVCQTICSPHLGYPSYGYFKSSNYLAYLLLESHYPRCGTTDHPLTPPGRCLIFRYSIPVNRQLAEVGQHRRKLKGPRPLHMQDDSS